MRKALVGSLLALPLLLIAGCAADTSDATRAAPDSDTDSEEAELRGMRLFDCRGGESGSESLTRMELAVSASKVKLTDLSRDASPPDSGTIDPSYRPSSPTYAGSSRFTGFDKISGSLSSDVSRVDLMVSKEIMDGGARGKLWIRTSGPEGAGTSSYTCTSKPKAVSVSLSKNARVYCDMSPLVCGAGAPPGETCLSDLFVSQTANDGATLRYKWLDHFGVNVRERSESIGASTSFARTKKTIEAKWGSATIDVTYRAGVTYLGDIKLADGRTGKVRCSDLAMLDD